MQLPSLDWIAKLILMKPCFSVLWNFHLQIKLQNLLWWSHAEARPLRIPPPESICPCKHMGEYMLQVLHIRQKSYARQEFVSRKEDERGNMRDIFKKVSLLIVFASIFASIWSKTGYFALNEKRIFWHYWIVYWRFC